MSQFSSSSLHRVEPGHARVDIAERSPQGRRDRIAGSVDFGALLDRMAPRGPEPTEATGRGEEASVASRQPLEREPRRLREAAPAPRPERHQPQDMRKPRDEAAPAEPFEAAEPAQPEATGGGDAARDGAAPHSKTSARTEDAATPAARDTAEEAGSTFQAEPATQAPRAADEGATQVVAEVGLDADPASHAAHVVDVASNPAAATLLALAFPAQQATVAPTSGIPFSPAADPLAAHPAVAAAAPAQAAMAATGAAMPAIAPAGQAASAGASDPAFGAMLQAQVASLPREVQAAPQQPRFPEAAAQAEAQDAAAPAGTAVSQAPAQAQLAQAPTPAGATLVAPQSQVAIETSSAAIQVAAAQPREAAPIVRDGAGVVAASGSSAQAAPEATAIQSAQPFVVTLEDEAPIGEVSSQPQAALPSSAQQPRPQSPASTPVAAQLVAQGQPADGAAQAQAQAGQVVARPAETTKPDIQATDRTAIDAAAPVRKDGAEALQAAAAAAPAAHTEAASTVDAASARAMRMPAHPAVAQVAVSVAKAAQDGVERITIKLQPPELGRIDVKIEVAADGRIQAVFAAERAATVDILQREVRELERALQGAGLDAGGGLSFGLKQNGGNGGQGAYAGLDRGHGGDGRGQRHAEEDARQPLPRRMATADGRVDIHV